MGGLCADHDDDDDDDDDGDGVQYLDQDKGKGQWSGLISTIASTMGRLVGDDNRSSVGINNGNYDPATTLTPGGRHQHLYHSRFSSMVSTGADRMSQMGNNNHNNHNNNNGGAGEESRSSGGGYW